MTTDVIDVDDNVIATAIILNYYLTFGYHKFIGQVDFEIRPPNRFDGQIPNPNLTIESGRLPNFEIHC